MLSILSFMPPHGKSCIHLNWEQDLNVIVHNVYELSQYVVSHSNQTTEQWYDEVVHWNEGPPSCCFDTILKIFFRLDLLQGYAVVATPLQLLMRP